jgi:hypothetical protein
MYLDMAKAAIRELRALGEAAERTRTLGEEKSR